jgi:glyoxylase-like metal-dependent hydrolase (beta-lactamase superfamily II)
MKSRRLLPEIFKQLTKPFTVMDGVFQLRTPGARVTALFSKDGILLVDAGGRGSLPWIASGLNWLGASLDDIRLIVLTHYHPDHAGGLGRILGETTASLAVHSLEVNYISGRSELPNPFRPVLLRQITKPFIRGLYSGKAEASLALTDGDPLPWSEEVRVIHTPGHTPGSICLYLPSKRLLIAGDAMQRRFGRLGPPSAAVTLDPPQALLSLRKLLELDLESIGFSHFSALQGGANAQLRQLLKGSQTAYERGG